MYVRFYVQFYVQFSNKEAIFYDKLRHFPDAAKSAGNLDFTGFRRHLTGYDKLCQLPLISGLHSHLLRELSSGILEKWAFFGISGQFTYSFSVRAKTVFE